MSATVRAIIAVTALTLLASLTPSDAATGKSRGQCTAECGGVRGGCAANTPAAHACFNRCMGTNECPVGPPGKKQKKK